MRTPGELPRADTGDKPSPPSPSYIHAGLLAFPLPFPLPPAPQGFGSIPRLTDASLRALAAAPCRTHLTQVYMASLPNVTSEVMGRGRIQLTTDSISSCLELLWHVGVPLPMQYMMYLSPSTLVSCPQGLSALLSGCPSLAAVAADGCELLTAANQRLLAERYPYVYDGDVVPEEYVRLACGEDGYGG